MRKFMKLFTCFLMTFSFVSLVNATSYEMSNIKESFGVENINDEEEIYIYMDDYYDFLKSGKESYDGEFFTDITNENDVNKEVREKGYVACDINEGKCTVTNLAYPIDSQILFRSTQDTYDVNVFITLFDGAELSISNGVTVNLKKGFVGYTNSKITSVGNLNIGVKSYTLGTVMVSGKGKITGDYDVTFNNPTVKVTANTNATNTVEVVNREDRIYYIVYRATSKSGKYKSVGTISDDNTKYVDKDVKVGSTYYYKVRPYQVVSLVRKYGPYSVVKSAKAKLGATTVTATSKDKTTITVKWDKVSGASGYVVYRATSKNGTYKAIKTTTSTSYTDKKLTTGKTYYYKVRTYKTISKKKYYGGYSSVKSAVPKVGKPKFTVSNYDYDSLKITITKVSGASGYEIYRATGTGAYKLVTTTTKTTYIDKKLTTGEKYNYKVKAYALVSKKKKYGDYSSVVSEAPILKTPTFTVISGGSDDELTIKITKVNGATGYEIYKLNDGEYELIKTTTDLTYKDTSLTLGTKYSYKVKAYRGTPKNYSEYSKVVSEQVVPKTLKVEGVKYHYNVGFVQTVISQDDYTDDVIISVYKKVGSSDYKLVTSASIKDVKRESLDDITESEVSGKLISYYKDNTYVVSYLTEKLDYGKSYSYTMTITKDGVESNLGSGYSFKTTLDKPETITIRNEFNSVLVGSSAIDGATGYEIYRATSKSGKYSKIYSGSSNRTTSKGTFGKKYYYKVRAYRYENGEKVYSSYSNVEVITHNVLAIDKFPVNFNGSSSDITLKSAKLTYKRTSGNYVYYTLKLTFKETYAVSKTGAVLTLYFYDEEVQKNFTQYLRFYIPKGTKKSWSESFDIKIPKNSVYYQFQ